MDDRTNATEAGSTMSEPSIHPQTFIGHVHLKVSDLNRSVRFYQENFGFELQQKFGNSAAFLSAGGYHHHLGLNTWESRGGPPAPRQSAGLYHFAILYPNRLELARALHRLLEHGIEIDGASDHGVSEAIYLHDPDGNGIEIYRDRDPSEWPRMPDGELAMVSDPLDLRDLLRELKADNKT
jgi:catechol 2,3-dioxygenase